MYIFNIRFPNKNFNPCNLSLPETDRNHLNFVSNKAFHHFIRKTQRVRTGTKYYGFFHKKILSKGKFKNKFDNYDEVVPGSEIPISMKGENPGTAPPYREHRIAFRLKDKQGDTRQL